jgi:very-short-patch-repair endonuclease
VTRHADPRVVDENKLNPMQQRNKRIDEYKNRWALANGIPLIRIWEKDIREKPKQVLDELAKILGLQKTKMSLLENKNKRHKNNIK